jgi:hypothetical protein
MPAAATDLSRHTARETRFDAHGGHPRCRLWMAPHADTLCEWIVANADRPIPYADRSFLPIYRSTRA